MKNKLWIHILGFIISTIILSLSIIIIVSLSNYIINYTDENSVMSLNSAIISIVVSSLLAIMSSVMIVVSSLTIYRLNKKNNKGTVKKWDYHSWGL